MCIIVAKKRNVKFPSMETLENCWAENSHGAGIMYPEDGKVIVVKGLMTWDAFQQEIDKLKSKHNLDSLAMVMHFRISTQGGINPENTHPFPISTRHKDLLSLMTSSKIGAVAHNGIISRYSNYEANEKYSDTFYFVRDCVAKSIHRSKSLKRKVVQEYLEKISNSKLAILLPDSTLITIGDFIDDQGVLYSNRTYLYSKSYGYLNFDYGALYGDCYSDDDEYWDFEEEAVVSTMPRYPKGVVRSCTAGMFFFDDITRQYCPCLPNVHYYDQDLALWWWDRVDGRMVSLDAKVYRPRNYYEGRIGEKREANERLSGVV